MDWNKHRLHFPVTRDYVFLNHAAVCPIPDTAAEALARFSGTAADAGSEAIPAWVERQDHVRGDLAHYIGASKKETAFVSSTSHGLSIVANGIRWKEGDNVIVPDAEFPSNVYPWMNLKRLGVELRWWRSRNRRLEIDDLRGLLDSRTRLVSVSAVQYGSGFRLDLGLVSTLLKEHGILFCVDGIQQVGCIPMDVKKLGIDFMAADGHKWMLSVEGLGFLYCDSNALDKIHPAAVGWKSVVNALEFDTIDFSLLPHAGRFEMGSLNTAGIYALGASIELLSRIGTDKIFSRISALLDLLVEGLKSRNLNILTPLDHKERSGILIFTTGKNDKAVYNALKKANIIVSLRGGGIRVSPHFYNTPEEIEIFLRTLDEAPA